jgi:hypothetical protein
VLQYLSLSIIEAYYYNEFIQALTCQNRVLSEAVHIKVLREARRLVSTFFYTESIVEGTVHIPTRCQSLLQVFNLGSAVTVRFRTIR